MPGYHRAELSAEMKIVPSAQGEKAPRAQIEAGQQAANTSGLARESGPDSTTLAGGRSEVLGAVFEVIEASLDAGARVVEVKVEAQEEPGRFSGAGGRRGSR